MSEEKHEVMDAEIKCMVENGTAEPSSSSWEFPCLLVDESDKSQRLCVCIIR